jgi:low temperature requirement protein LtrA
MKSGRKRSHHSSFSSTWSFVFALSELSHHLLDNLTWHGAAETLVLLVAMFTVWSYTSFEATMLQVSRTQAAASLRHVTSVAVA